MPPPLEGAGSATETRNSDVITLNSSDEDISKINSQESMDSEHTANAGSSEGHSSTVHQPPTALQKIDKIKYFNLKPDKYNPSNIYVYVEKTNDQNIGRLHPMYVGHILHKKLKLQNILDIKSIGKNRIKVQLKSIVDANNLVNNKLLHTENLRAFIPNHLLEKKGLIRGVDTFFDVSYLKENIECSTPITDIKRTHRRIERDGKTEYIPKQTIIVTFEGNVLPNFVFINKVVCPVESFLGRVTQCFKCLKYGHVANQCRGTNTLCISCGNTKMENHTCKNDQQFCIYCKTKDHISIDKTCPYYANQKTIKRIMIENNISYVEARKMSQSSYSSITSVNRFQVLPSNMEYNSNFPSLPKSQNSNIFSFSQPNPNSVSADHSTHSQTHRIRPGTSGLGNNSSGNKKRKASSPAIQSPPPTPMFPFRFGPSSSLPPNPHKPDYTNSITGNNKLMESLSNYILNILGKINSLEDIKKLDSQIVRNDIEMVFKDTFYNT